MSFGSQMAISFYRAARLRGRTRLLYNSLSWLMVLLGVVLVGALMLKSRMALGLPMTRAPLEGIRLRVLAWFVLTLVSIPTLFYCAMFLVGSIFGLLMVVARRFSLADARAMALYGQPPAHWIEAGAAEPPGRRR